jgi:hypothetical protein
MVLVGVVDGGQKVDAKDTLVGFGSSFVCVAYEATYHLYSTRTVNAAQTHHYATFNSLSCYASLLCRYCYPMSSTKESR